MQNKFETLKSSRASNSAEEFFLYTEGVGGSNPSLPIRRLCVKN